MARFAKNSALYTDILPENATVYELPMVDGNNGERRCNDFVLRGVFKHQSIVTNFIPMLASNDRKPMLIPLASVIAARPIGGRTPEQINVEDADFVRMDGVVYQIRDNRMVHNPQLVPLAE